MDLTQLDPFSATFLDDPYPVFARLRDESPVHHVASRKMWMVTRYEDVVAVARNHAVFSSTGGVGYDWNQRPMMPMYDPPEHTRMRRIVAKQFTPAFVGTLAPRVDALASELVADALEKGSIDLVHDVALPLSIGTIAALLGVKDADRGRLRRWSRGTIDDLAGGLSPTEARKVDELRREFNVFLRSLIDEKRALVRGGGTPADIISLLVAASDDDRLSANELLAFCVLLMVAGHETTANAICNGTQVLVDRPELAERLRASPELIGPFVEEAVRYDGPVLSFFRNTLTDVVLAGTTIPQGQKVMLAFASANRDPRHFERPDEFLLDRTPNDHVGYGIGVHYCLGAALARLELGSIFRALIGSTQAIEANAPPRRWASVLFRGMREQRVKLTARDGARKSGSLRPPPESDPFLGSAPAAGGLAVEPFEINVEESVLEDLKTRLRLTRWPDQIPWTGWDYGADVNYMKELTAYWLDRYDWRAQERALNAFPNRRARIGELTIHFVHQKAKTPTKHPPLLLLHGWPGSYRVFTRIIEPLTAGPGPTFDVVVASLPGYVFSSAPAERGVGPMRMAEVMDRLMVGLGYERYGIVGEDWGAGVASRMAFTTPERVVGLHLNMPFENPPRDQLEQLTDEEKRWLKGMGRIHDKELHHIPFFQRRPQSIGFALQDSPVGLAALLVDTYSRWSDHANSVEDCFSRDDLLTNTMLYWVTGSMPSALRIYFEAKQLQWWLAQGERIEVPTAIALTKKEFLKPPRRWIERAYNLQRLTHFEKGGHFGAWEMPQEWADDIRTFFSTC